MVDFGCNATLDTTCFMVTIHHIYINFSHFLWSIIFANPTALLSSKFYSVFKNVEMCFGYRKYDSVTSINSI